jgi:hypothetical protein
MRYARQRRGSVSPESEPVGYPEPDGTVTGGHSGTDTSKQRALDDANSGTKRKREIAALALLGQRGRRGVTVAELRYATRMHHGQASSVLSTLHKAGRILRLKDKRDRCHIYVLPAYVFEREIEPFGRQKMVLVEDLWEAFMAGVHHGSEQLSDGANRMLFEQWLEEER